MRIDTPTIMKAAILVEQRKPLIVTEVELPQQLEPGQVLVRLEYSGICGSQLGEIDGVKGPDKYLPHLLGHEGSGTVVSLGPGVRTVKEDDAVVLHWRKGSGIESDPPVYRSDLGPVNAGLVTTFNEYAVVSENRLTRIPQEFDRAVATLFGCAVTTGFGVVQNDAKLKIGESVVVYGSGGVGLSIVQASALVSAYPIIAVDLQDNRLELAKDLGATHTINGNSENVSDQIQQILGSYDLDVFIDNTGNTSVIETGYALTGASGRTILVGVPKSSDNISIHSLPLHFGKILTGSHGGGASPESDIPRYTNLYSEGKLRLKHLISNTYPLNSINDAIADMRSGSVTGRVLVRLS